MDLSVILLEFKGRSLLLNYALLPVLLKEEYNYQL
jgi:hypothetical protein